MQEMYLDFWYHNMKKADIDDWYIRSIIYILPIYLHLCLYGFIYVFFIEFTAHCFEDCEQRLHAALSH